MSEHPKEGRKSARTAAKTSSRGAAKGAAAPPARKSKKNLAILVLVVIALLAAGIAWLVHSNNVQSKATHEQFAAAESAFRKADTSYKEAAQKLKTEANSCTKSYSAYDVCPALSNARTDIEKSYADVAKQVEAIDANAVDKMPEATQTYKTSTSTVQELERRAVKAVEDYSDALLEAVRKEHAEAMNEARTNLKEAKALLSTSEGRTSDVDLWKAISEMLAVHEKELDAQDKVSSDKPEEMIASTQIVRTESAAIESEMNHLNAIYDPKATPSPSEEESEKAKGEEKKDASAEQSASADADKDSASAQPSEKAAENASPEASAKEEGTAEDPDA